MRTRLLEKLRYRANGKCGVFRLSNGRYAVVWDKTLWDDVSEFKEELLDMYGYDYQYQVIDVMNTYDEAVNKCDECRRQYILSLAREKRYKNKKRLY